jgi:hypothetical protein
MRVTRNSNYVKKHACQGNVLGFSTIFAECKREVPIQNVLPTAISSKDFFPNLKQIVGIFPISYHMLPIHPLLSPIPLHNYTTPSFQTMHFASDKQIKIPRPQFQADTSDHYQHLHLHATPTIRTSGRSLGKSSNKMVVHRSPPHPCQFSFVYSSTTRIILPPLSCQLSQG